MISFGEAYAQLSGKVGKEGQAFAEIESRSTISSDTVSCAGDYDSLSAQEPQLGSSTVASSSNLPAQRAASWTGGFDAASASKESVVLADSRTTSRYAFAEVEENEEDLSASKWDFPAMPQAGTNLALPSESHLLEAQIDAAGEDFSQDNALLTDADKPAQSSPVKKGSIFSEASQNTVLENDAALISANHSVALPAQADASQSGEAAAERAQGSAFDEPLPASASPIEDKVSEAAAIYPSVNVSSELDSAVFQMPQEEHSRIFASTSSLGSQSIAGLGMAVMSAMGGGPQALGGGLQTAEAQAVEALRESQGSNAAPALPEDITVPVTETRASPEAEAQPSLRSSREGPRNGLQFWQSAESSKSGTALPADLAGTDETSTKAYSKSAKEEREAPEAPDHNGDSHHLSPFLCVVADLNEHTPVCVSLTFASKSRHQELAEAVKHA